MLSRASVRLARWAACSPFLWASACVSQSQYQQLQSDYQRLQQEDASRQAQSQKTLQAQSEQSEKARQEQEQAMRACRADQTEIQEQANACEQGMEQLQQEYSQVVHDRGALRIAAKELRDSYQLLRQRALRKSARNKSRKELENSMREMIAAQALELREEEAALVLVLPADPLFSLGAAQLSSQGRTQLRALGQELNRLFASRRYCLQVQGHSDNVPKRTATIRNNWELSAARALAVVQRLIEAGLAPQTLSAAAYASVRPRADNASRRGRALNRRIEIAIARCS